MLTNVTEVTPLNLHAEVFALRRKGYRFVTMTCSDLGDGFDVLYHFDLNYELCHLRLRLPLSEPLPSISDVFFAAVLIENEIKDMFGIDVQGMAIDYKGRFLLAEDAPKAPLLKALGVPIDARLRPRQAAAEGQAS